VYPNKFQQGWYDAACFSNVVYIYSMSDYNIWILDHQQIKDVENVA
jgi:hypothetical protein